jgi:hypothetical protein
MSGFLAALPFAGIGLVLAVMLATGVILVGLAVHVSGQREELREREEAAARWAAWLETRDGQLREREAAVRWAEGAPK